MDKIMDFLKENFYYVVGGFIIFILIIIIMAACSAGSGNKKSTYEVIETNMVEAAKEYYDEHKTELAKLDLNDDENKEVSVAVTVKKLVENKYMKEIKDPSKKDNICTGFVEVMKIGKSFHYQPKLSCGKYSTSLLNEKIIKKAGKLDEVGNGLYNVSGEYVYRGDKVKNYIKFNGELWRIIKIDSDGDIKIISEERTEQEFIWDDRYNVKEEDYTGINDFKKSRIKDRLKKYYNDKYKTSEVSSLIVPKNFCVGKSSFKGALNNEICSDTYKLYIGLIDINEFYRASLEPNCKYYGQKQCSNYNYLAMEFSNWTLTADKYKNSKVYGYSDIVEEHYTDNEKKVKPVLNITNKAIYRGGNGTKNDPYSFN